MLFKRLIPKIVVEKTNVECNSSFSAILTRSFQLHRMIGDPLSQIRIQQSNLVDEIMLIHRNRSLFNFSFCELIERISETLNTPLAAGGAISDLLHVHAIFNSGADKIVIGRAKSDLKLLDSIASNYGRQSLVVSIDYTDEDLKNGNDKFVHDELAKGYFEFAGEICLTNVSRDGTGRGIDFRLVSLVKDATDAPIVVSGGASNVSHLLRCFQEGCDAVTLSTFLSQTDQNIKQIRSHLSTMGVHIRTRN